MWNLYNDLQLKNSLVDQGHCIFRGDIFALTIDKTLRCVSLTNLNAEDAFRPNARTEYRYFLWKQIDIYIYFYCYSLCTYWNVAHFTFHMYTNFSGLLHKYIRCIWPKPLHDFIQFEAIILIVYLLFSSLWMRCRHYGRKKKIYRPSQAKPNHTNPNGLYRCNSVIFFCFYVKIRIDTSYFR